MANLFDNLEFYLGQILSLFEAKYLGQIFSQTFFFIKGQYLAQKNSKSFDKLDVYVDAALVTKIKFNFSPPLNQGTGMNYRLDSPVLLWHPFSLFVTIAKVAKHPGQCPHPLENRTH